MNVLGALKTIAAFELILGRNVGLIDYRPVKWVDVYAGVALSNVYVGLANRFRQTQNIDPTVGVRIKF
jgi:hypothetical protein